MSEILLSKHLWKSRATIHTSITCEIYGRWCCDVEFLNEMRAEFRKGCSSGVEHLFCMQNCPGSIAGKPLPDIVDYTEIDGISHRMDCPHRWTGMFWLGIWQLLYSYELACQWQHFHVSENVSAVQTLMAVEDFSNQVCHLPVDSQPSPLLSQLPSSNPVSSQMVVVVEAPSSLKWLRKRLKQITPFWPLWKPCFVVPFI